MNNERPTPRLVPSASRLKRSAPAVPPPPQAPMLDEGPTLDPHWHKKRGEVGLQFAASFQEDSLGHVIRELARAAWRLGYEVAIEQRETRGLGKASWPTTSIRHLRGQVRPPMCIVAWGTHNCGRDFFGTPRVFMDVPDSLHFADVAQMRKYNHDGDLFLTVTQSALADYERAGLSVPGAVVPLGVDRNVFRPCEKDMDLILEADWHGEPLTDETWFVLLAGYMQPRKGVDLAIEALKQVFKPQDDVAILFKTVVGRWGRDISADVVEALGDSGLRFGLLTESIPEHQFARLLGSADCYLAPHRREGFGLIPLQALSCGTPVVTTRYDGPTTYLTDDNAILIEPVGLEAVPIRKSEDGKVLEVDPGGAGNGDTDTWATLDVRDIARAVDRCYKEHGLVQEARRIEAGLATAEEWSWERSAQFLVDAVQAHIGPVRKRPQRGYPALKRRGLTIAVPARNAQEELDRLCASVEVMVRPPAFNLEETWPFELLVLDDASDPPLTLPSRFGRLIRSDAWIGEGAARDWLMREARGEFIFQTDADVEFNDPLWASKLSKDLPPKTIRHPLMLNADGTIWSDGGCYTMYADGFHPSWHYHLCGDGDGPHEGPCVYAPGAGWFMRTAEVIDFWDWIGGYFPTIFADVDMAFWLRAHGFTFEAVPEAIVTHHHGSYTSGQSRTEEARQRYLEHYTVFCLWWDFLIDDDIARGARVCQ